MPTGNRSLLRESIRAAVAQRAGLRDSAAAAEATAATWRLVAAQLAPVIGARGLEVLFRRAMHKTTAAFPWFAADLEPGGLATPLPSIAQCLAGQDPAVAAEASYTLLLTFTELLMTLIGEPLTTQLLAPVWAGPLMSSGQESAL